MIRNKLVLHCSENNVHKLKNRYEFTWFIVAKYRKSRNRCIKQANISFENVTKFIYLETKLHSQRNYEQIKSGNTSQQSSAFPSDI
jgi:hypothetical protein